MDTTKDITAAVQVATIDAIDNAIEKKGGIVAKTVALKHLTEILLNDFEHQFGYDKGKPGRLDTDTVFTVDKSTLATLAWVVSEVCETSSDLDRMLDDIANDLVHLSNAGYAAKNGALTVKVGA